VIGGGVDRDHVRPSNANKPDIIGDHRGQFEGLNVRNPQTGVRYMYENIKSGGGSRVLSRLNQGYTLVRAGDPEAWGGTLPINHGGTPDGLHVFGDVALMRIPLPLYAKLQEEERQIARAAANRAEDSFRDKGESLKVRLGSRVPQDLYYARNDHNTQEE